MSSTMTVNSSAVSYLTAAEFLKRCDYNTVGQLVSDNQLPVDPVSLASDANLATALLGASGELESRCISAKRYQPTDLAALTGAAANYRDDVLTGLAVPRLFQRRPTVNIDHLKFWIEKATNALKELGDGHAIFGFVEVQAAGLIDVTPDTPQDVENRYLTVVQMNRFFGRRGNQRTRCGNWNGGW